MLPSLLAAFAALASSGSSFPLEAHSLEQRQQQVPVNVSWANQGLSTANVIDGDGNVGAYSTDPYTGTGLISCDRSRYSFSLNINQENVDRGNTYRFIFGQTRYGSQGAFIPGDKIFIDRTYNDSQVTQRDQGLGQDGTISGLYFPMYPGDTRSELVTHPWVLSKDNTTEGFVLPGQFTVLGHVYRANGSELGPYPNYGNITVRSFLKDCTPEYTATTEAKATSNGVLASRATLYHLVLLACAATAAAFGAL